MLVLNQTFSCQVKLNLKIKVSSVEQQQFTPIMMVISVKSTPEIINIYVSVNTTVLGWSC